MITSTTRRDEARSFREKNSLKGNLGDVWAGEGAVASIRKIKVWEQQNFEI